MSPLILWVAGVFLASPAIAEEDTEKEPQSHHHRRFEAWLGALFTRIDSEVTLDGSTLPGGGLDGENLLGLSENKTVVFGGAIWRFHARNTLEFEYIELNRSRSGATVSDPVQIGDTTVQFGGRIDTAFDISLARLTYGFNFIVDPRKTFAIKAGIHLLDSSATLQLSGDLIVNGQPMPVDPTIPIIEDGNVAVPLPHLGMSFAYEVTPKLVLRLEGIGFALGYDDFDGSVFEAIADVQYWPWKNFGVGAGYRYFGFDVEDEDIDGLDGQLKFNYHGPSLYITAGF
jgi:opacity protein-like surface antigen